MPTYTKQITRLKDRALEFRLRVVKAALTDGVSRTARTFHTTRLTVRKWRDRYKLYGKAGLLERSRRAHRNRMELPPDVQARLIGIRKLCPCISAKRLARVFNFAIHHTTIQRTWNRHGLKRS
jgi:transposase-like protein